MSEPEKESLDFVSSDAFCVTEVAKEYLVSIHLHARLNHNVLLQGPPGIGKTSLIQHYALSQDKDPKVLLGSYIAGETPGSFHWMPGVLTKAVKSGKWILIHDIHLAPASILSILISLLESRLLFIPSRSERIVAHPDFRIFATRINIDSASNHSTIENLWSKVFVEAPTEEDVHRFSLHKFPSMPIERSKILISAFLFVEHTSRETSAFSRQITLSDYFKWLNRVQFIKENQGLERLVNEEILREAHDCFLAHLPDHELRKELFIKLGQFLDIPDYRADFLFSLVPEIKHSGTSFSIGRFERMNTSSGKDDKSSSSTFAYTNHALKLSERVAVAMKHHEHLLLVGETGTGKTTIVQQLASLFGKKLLIVNMSQQSDASDLLGGYKPVEARTIARSLKQDFDDLFPETFNIEKNQAFVNYVSKVFVQGKWKLFAGALSKALGMAQSAYDKISSIEDKNADKVDFESPPKKQKKTSLKDLMPSWYKLDEDVQRFKRQLEHLEKSLLFAFVEGSLVQAVKKGYWILLDEVNLAPSETLECISGLLQSAQNASLLLTEKGDTEPIKPHPDFRIFGCMNPANDAGKHQLPPGIRMKFTEIWVDSPDIDPKDLKMIVARYLKHHVVGMEGEQFIECVASFYYDAKKLSSTSTSLLLDGANRPVHYSIRTLTRSLSYANTIALTYGIKRAVYEGLVMTFTTQLNSDSRKHLEAVLTASFKPIIKNLTQLLSHTPPKPHGDRMLFGSFWLQQGSLYSEHMMNDSNYIITESVRQKLNDLARGVMAVRFPILIQGPTSAGKTSIIEYLAKQTGHRFVRINNHEHTDLQEYLGSYVSTSDGKLVFKEGILVEAMRKGYWIVLDELNLAPSDVLEALNRLLDDNRELFIPETQEIVKPHPNFMLFATQNPPGLYGGRKVLSRAFRNRFLELHFDDLPIEELQEIIEKRCEIAPSYAAKIVQVYQDLGHARQQARIFDGKQGFVTLRDLFRWANRKSVGYQNLAYDGFMILGERTRTTQDRLAVKECLERVLKVKVSIDAFYNQRFNELVTQWNVVLDPNEIVWTFQMKRLYVLIGTCLLFNEPVLLVGETGCGKTTACQLVARHLGKSLHILNAHQNTETSDFLGSQRPIRNHEKIREEAIALFNNEIRGAFGLDELDDLKEIESSIASITDTSNSLISRLRELLTRAKSVFAWSDGPLVQAMKDGSFFLLDEISLADDSVLERLNSLLEPQRSLVLAEKHDGSDSLDALVAHESFQFLATMNPGGDYGKKELSLALRNRFTEIYAPQVDSRDDLVAIINASLPDASKGFDVAGKMVDFLYWLSGVLGKEYSEIFSVRDVLSWTQFITAVNGKVAPLDAFIDGACMLVVDGIGANPVLSCISIPSHELRLMCQNQLELITGIDPTHRLSDITYEESTESLSIGGFSIEKGADGMAIHDDFSLAAPTTRANCMRIMRALQVNKPVLLEGSPGVGKTSLISKLASLAGFPIVRINLSEQTDLMDLFGSDLPVESSSSSSDSSPKFEWRNGPFLDAMVNGHWVLLDELNLASQQVLEGLNACLDHRGAVYIPELDRTFVKHPLFRLFGAQNPQDQGGGRKGLPKSFLNRFTKVFVQEMTRQDLIVIAQSVAPSMSVEIIERMIDFTVELSRKTMVQNEFGSLGSPWEFNLRDTIRWLQLLKQHNSNEPALFVETIFTARFRTIEDRQHVRSLFKKVFGEDPIVREAHISISDDELRVGRVSIPRNNTLPLLEGSNDKELIALRSYGRYYEMVLECIKMNWLTMIYGAPGTGKTSLVRMLARLTGNRLEEFTMNDSIDTLEILGGFEQVDRNRKFQVFRSRLIDLLHVLAREPDFAGVGHEISEIVNDGNVALPEIQKIFELLMEIHSNSANSALLSSVTKQSIQASQEYINSLRVDCNGRFEWVDGSLIRAMQEGTWLMIDHANLCSASVLDRLNSLFEPNGSIILNERGLVNGEIQNIKPHPNFRVFMVMDPARGEISRAMRNRGIEICILPETGLVLSPRLAQIPWIQKYDTYRLLALNDWMYSDIGQESLQNLHLLKDFRYRAAAIAKGLAEAPCPDTLHVPTIYPYFVNEVNLSEQARALSVIEHCLLSDQFRIQNDLDPRELVEVAVEMLKVVPRSDSFGLLRRIIDSLGTPHELHGPLILALDALHRDVALSGPNAFHVINLEIINQNSLKKNLKDLGALELSFALSSGRIRESQLPLAFLTEMAPLMLDLAHNQLENSNKMLKKVLFYAIVDHLNERTPDAYTLQALLENVSSFSPQATEVLNSFVSCFNHGFIRLWETSRPITFLSEHHATTFYALLDTSRKHRLDLTSLHAFLEFLQYCTNESLKETMADALVALVQLCHTSDTLPEHIDQVRDMVIAFQPQLPLVVNGSFSSHAARARLFSSVFSVVLNDIDVISSLISRQNCFEARLYKTSIDAVDLVRLRTRANKGFSIHELLWKSTHGLTSLLRDVNLVQVTQHDEDESMSLFSNEQVLPFLFLQKQPFRGTDLLYSSQLSDVLSLILSLNDQQSFVSPMALDQIKQSCGSLSSVGMSRVDGRLAAASSIVAHLHMLSIVDEWSEITRDLLLSLEKDPLNVALLNDVKGCMDILSNETASVCIQEIIASAINQTASEWIPSLGRALLKCATQLLKTLFSHKKSLIDPVYLSNARHAVAKGTLEQARKVTLTRLILLFLLGSGDGSTIDSDLDQIEQEYNKCIESFARRVGFRPQHVMELVTNLASDMDHFVQSIIPEAQLDFIQSESDADEKFSVELMLQSNIDGFVQRLEHKYSMLHDLIQPIISLVYSVKSGLRMIVDGTRTPAVVPHEFFDMLLPVPSFDLPMPLTEEEERYLNVAQLFDLLDVKPHLSTLASATIENILAKTSRSWIDELKKAHQADLDSSSLYRFKQKLQEDDIIKDYHEEDVPQKQLQCQFGMQEAQSLVLIFYLSFYGNQTMDKYPKYKPHGTSLGWRLRAVRRMLNVVAVPQEADQAMLESILYMLHKPESCLTETNLFSDLYSDSSEAETSAFFEFIEKLDVQVAQLLTNWPTNQILLDIQMTVYRMSQQLSTRTPVMKLHASAEVLLGKCHEWESYASSSVSLKESVDELIQMIIKWRKLELESWKAHLFTLEVKCELEMSSMWAFLYGSIVVAAGDDDVIFLNNQKKTTDDQAYYAQVLENCVNFISTSSFGQFKARKALLSAIVAQLGMHPSPRSRKASMIIDNVISCYSQYEPKIMSSIQAKRKQVSEQIKNFAKIASWKDVNVFALKETSAKTHRQLTKYLKSYNEFLHAPVTELLVESSFGHLDKAVVSGKVDHFSDVPPVITTESSDIEFLEKPLLSRAHQIMTRMVKLTKGLESTASESIERLDDFSVEIIVAVKEFEKENKEIEAQTAMRGYKTRRRKALVDLLRALSDMGLTRGTQRFALIDCASTDLSSEEGNGLVGRRDVYHFRSVKLMQDLIEAAKNHSPELLGRVPQRMTAYAEHLFEISRHQRNTHIALMDHSKHLQSVCASLVSNSDYVIETSRLSQLQESLGSLVRKLSVALDKIQVFLESNVSNEWDECRSKTMSLMPVLHQATSSIGSAVPHVLPVVAISETDLVSLENVIEMLKSIRYEIEMGSSLHSKHLYRHVRDLLSVELPPVESAMKQLIASRLHSSAECPPLHRKRFEDIDEAAEKVVKAIMCGFQDLHALLSLDNQTRSTADKSLVIVNPQIVAGAISRMNTALDSFSLAVGRGDLSVENGVAHLMRIYSVLQQSIKAYCATIRMMGDLLLQANKATYKLGYILQKVFLLVMRKGYNIPEGHEEDDKEQDDEKATDGQGLGEGSGQNVAQDDVKDIDFEDGLVEEKGDQQQEQEEELGPEDPMDVDFDFESKFEDIEDDSENSGASSDEDEEKDNEMDEEMGDLDGEGDAIDEKLWNEEDEKQQQPNNEKDASSNEKKAQEQEELQASSEDKKEGTQEETGEQDVPQGQEEEEDQTVEEQQVNQEDSVEERHLDIKEDMIELSDDEEERQEGEEQQPQASMEEEQGAAEENDEDLESVQGEEEDNTAQTQMDSQPQADGGEDELGSVVDEDEAEQDDSNEKEEDEDESVDQQEKHGLEPVEGIEDGQGQDAVETGEQDSGDQRDSESKEAKGEAAVVSDEEEEQEDGQGGQGMAMEQENQQEEKEGKESRERAQVESLEQLEAKMRKWIQEHQKKEMQDAVGKNQQDAMVTFADDEDEAQDASLELGEQQHQSQREEKQQQVASRDEERVRHEKEPEDRHMDIEAQEDQVNELRMEMKDSIDEVQVNETSQAITQQLEQVDITSDMDEEEEEAKMSHSTKDNDSLSREMWRDACIATSNLSFALCEQLRLILEPTLATKYKGDYKTGKRLNMRKIIPYIASNYKKDKIWLRKTKPSKRTYQIMLAIDDSKSMKDSRCDQMAYQSLALISKALHQLEVGEVSVVGFGESTQIIHDFSMPLSDEAGVRMFQSLSFDQDKTNVKSMLQTTVTALEKARTSSRNQELWQLLLIISDGICQHHNVIKSLVSYAIEHQVLVVFIVLDTRQERDSIMKMTTVSYDTHPGTGKTLIKMEKYMDTFPFEYFILLKDIDALPGVLSDTLRQYFSYVNSL